MNESARWVKFGRIVDAYLAPLSFVGGLTFILYTTLWPFRFHVNRLSPAGYIEGMELLPGSFFDFPRNIVLFIPMSFGLAAILDKRGWSRKQILVAVTLIGLLVTVTVESMQFYLPYRQPSVSDIVSNTLGAVAGVACFHLWQKREETADWLHENVSANRLVLLAMAVYLLFLLVMAVGLSSSVRLRKWEVDYRMIAGNERTGDRGWAGTLSDLVIFNRALDNGEARALLKNPHAALSGGESLRAYYKLNDDRPLVDLSGNQPDFSWRPFAETRGQDPDRQLDGHNWLETKAPVRDLSEKIEESSALSVRLSAAPLNIELGGPARILSVSASPYQRNLMLGQEGNDLVVRLRTPLMGTNGVNPQIHFSEFFNGLDPVDFVVTYDGLALELIDSRSQKVQSVEMMPGVAFYFTYIIPLLNASLNYGEVHYTETTIWIYRLLYYTLVLFPVGLLISLHIVKTWSRRQRTLFLFFGLVFVPLLLEFVMVARSGLRFRSLNIATSILLVAFVAWVIVPAGSWLISLFRKGLRQRDGDSL